MKIFEKGSSVCWDSDPARDSSIFFHGVVHKDEGGEYVEIQSTDYKNYLKGVKEKYKTVPSHDIIRSKDRDDVFAIRRSRIE